MPYIQDEGCFVPSIQTDLNFNTFHQFRSNDLGKTKTFTIQLNAVAQLMFCSRMVDSERRTSKHLTRLRS